MPGPANQPARPVPCHAGVLCTFKLPRAGPPNAQIPTCSRLGRGSGGRSLRQRHPSGCVSAEWPPPPVALVRRREGRPRPAHSRACWLLGGGPCCLRATHRRPHVLETATAHAPAAAAAVTCPSPPTACLHRHDHQWPSRHFVRLLGHVGHDQLGGLQETTATEPYNCWLLGCCLASSALAAASAACMPLCCKRWALPFSSCADAEGQGPAQI